MFIEWTDKQRFKEVDFSAPLFHKATDREFWADKYDESIVKNAEQYLGFEWPNIKASHYIAFKKEGNRKAQETPYGARRKALVALACAEILEHKGRFIADIVDGVFAICEETCWSLSAHPAVEGQNIPMGFPKHIDLFSAETAASLSIIHYVLYDELNDYCPEILLRIEKEVKERILDTYLRRTDYWWLGYYRKPNNWNPWVLSNVLYAFLLLEKDRCVLDAAIRKLFVEIDNYYKVMPDDGGCDEGLVYWMHAGGKLFEFCYLIHTATKGAIDVFEDEKLKNILRYLYRTYIGGNWFVNFADGSARVTNSVMPVMSYLCGLKTKDERFLSFAKNMSLINAKGTNDQLARSLYAIIYAKEIAAYNGRHKSDDICVLPQLQNCYMREGKWFYAAKGGHNHESHNHNDVGSFLVFYDNSPVLVDPGCGVYTKKTFSAERYDIWTMQAQWHNLPVINGRQQLFGEQYRCDRFDTCGKAVNIEFTSAYDKAAEVNSVKRSIKFADDGLDIADSFEFNKGENSVAEHFVTPLEVRVEGKAVIIDGKFRLWADGDCEIALDSVDFEGDAWLTKAWQADKINRIKFSFKTDDKAKITIGLRRI